MFSCEFCEISKNTFFTEPLLATASLHMLISQFTNSFANSPFTTIDIAIIRSSRLVVFCEKAVLTNFCKTHKNSQIFFKIDVLKRFTDSTGKYQCKRHFLINLQSWRLKESSTQVFSCEICKIFKNTIFYRTAPVAASDVTRIIKGFRKENRCDFLW